MKDLNLLKERIKEITTAYKAETIGGYITGDGAVPADILFVGEAPGKTEVEEGRPFVGVAGKTLQHYLDMINIARSNIRITNTCYFRPIKLKQSDSGRITVSNRPPKKSRD